MIGHDCSIDDGMISALIVAPFSTMDYLRLMWMRVRSNFHVSKIQTSIGYIRSRNSIFSEYGAPVQSFWGTPSWLQPLSR